MPLIEYPAGLPGPSASSFTPRDRLARSTLPGDALAGARERDFLGSEELGFVFSPDDAAAFDAWWRDTLYSGGLRFAAAWPLPPEFAGSRVRKFARSPTWSHIANGNWRMSVTTEVYGRMAAPELTPPESCVELLNHADETSGTTAESVVGPELTVTGAAALSAGAAVWGTGGVGPTGSGSYSLGTSDALIDPTQRHIEFEAWFTRTGTGDTDDNVTLLYLGNAGGNRYMRIAAAGNGGAAVLQYEGVNGATNVSIPAMGFTIDEPSRVVLKFNPDDGFFSVYQGVSRLTYVALGTEPGYFDGIDFTVIRPLDFATSEGNTGVFQVDEVRLTVCSTPIYSGESIEVPTGPFPDPA